MPQYTCRTCGLGNNQEATLQAHCRTTGHPEYIADKFDVRPNVSGAPLLCGDCGQSFFSRSLLDSHRRLTHNGPIRERVSFVCRTCAAKFSPEGKAASMAHQDRTGHDMEGFSLTGVWPYPGVDPTFNPETTRPPFGALIETGVSCATFQKQVSGNLFGWTMQNGLMILAGSVEAIALNRLWAKQGYNYIPVAEKEPVVTSPVIFGASPPVGGVNPGDVYIDKGIVHEWDGSKWNEIGEVKPV